MTLTNLSKTFYENLKERISSPDTDVLSLKPVTTVNKFRYIGFKVPDSNIRFSEAVISVTTRD